MNRFEERKSSGQALIEFTLLLPLIIIIVGGLTDLGLAFYVSIGVQNAVREGARIAATNPDLDGAIGLKGSDDNESAAKNAVKDAVLSRIPAIGQFSIPNSDSTLNGSGAYTAGVYVSDPSADTTCSANVTVAATGTYSFAFLRYIGFDTMTISRWTSMRYEDRALCT